MQFGHSLFFVIQNVRHIFNVEKENLPIDVERSE
jgi:hypothetical protein